MLCDVYRIVVSLFPLSVKQRVCFTCHAISGDRDKHVSSSSSSNFGSFMNAFAARPEVFSPDDSPRKWRCREAW